MASLDEMASQARPVKWATLDHQAMTANVVPKARKAVTWNKNSPVPALAASLANPAHKVPKVIMVKKVQPANKDLLEKSALKVLLACPVSMVNQAAKVRKDNTAMMPAIVLALDVVATVVLEVVEVWAASVVPLINMVAVALVAIKEAT